jgi:hypothetical protein
MDISGHRRIYVKERILHRDLSPGNLMFLRPKSTSSSQNVPIGILNDFDNAIILSSSYQNTRRSEWGSRIGTTPFMAISLLDTSFTKPEVLNRYCHDLESLFYILVWTVVGADRNRDVNGMGEMERLKNERRITGWEDEDWIKALDNKVAFLDSEGTRLIDCFVFPPHETSRAVCGEMMKAFARPLSDLRRKRTLLNLSNRAERLAWGAKCQSEEMGIFTWEKMARILGSEEKVVEELGMLDQVHYQNILIEQRMIL